MLIWMSRVLRLLLGLGAIAVAVGLFMFLAKSKQAPSQNETAGALPIVRAIRVEPQTVAMRWSGYGTARAMNSSNVAAEVSGRVDEVPEGIEAGVSVQKGDLLATIDPRDYASRVQASRRQADSLDSQIAALEIEESRLSEQASLVDQEIEAAQRDLDRARDALDRGAGNVSAVDARLQAVKALTRNRATLLTQLELIPSRRVQLAAALDAARADQRLAEDNLSRTEIRAPLSGVLQSVNVEAGEWARSGDTIARVVDLSVIEVPLSVPQNAIGRLRIGDEVTLSAEGVSQATWIGSIGRIAPETDPTIRSATIFVEVRQRPDTDASTLLRPGQFVMGAILSSETSESIVLPRKSVDAGRVLVAVSVPEGGPEIPAGARTPMVVREAEIDVSHYIEQRFSSVSPGETQWVVVRTPRTGPGAADAALGGGSDQSRGVGPDAIVLTSNLESLRPGDLVDIRYETEPPAASESGIAAKPTPSEEVAP